MSIAALGICGWSGSGKTTLIEQLVARLGLRGLSVAVLKHDAHALKIDHLGKDTDRFFRAGAVSVYAYDDRQTFQRSRTGNQLEETLRSAEREADLLLIEGLKEAPLPKIWLVHPRRHETRPDYEHLLETLEPGPERPDRAERIVVTWLERQWSTRQKWVGILIGGNSRRMGVPKTLLPLHGRTVIEILFEQARRFTPNVAFLGLGPLPENLQGAAPTLPDAIDAQGPLAGILGAMRWNPSAAWTIIACDMPKMNVEFINWLQSQRKPGIWAVLPKSRVREKAEPLAAIYEPQMLPCLETMAARGDLALYPITAHPKVRALSPPVILDSCLANANSPEEWRSLIGSTPASAPNRDADHLSTVQGARKVRS